MHTLPSTHPHIVLQLTTYRVVSSVPYDREAQCIMLFLVGHEL